MLTSSLPRRFNYVPLLICALYLLWVTMIIGFRNDHLLFVTLILGCYYLHTESRKFVIGFGAFAIYWMIYDSLRIIPNDILQTVHIQEPYDIEKSLFGLNTGADRITINEYFIDGHTPFFDVLAGLFYLNWVTAPFALSFYFWRTDKKSLLQMSYLFLLTNFIGFVIYYIYPAAPPWYVELYGFEYKADLSGDPAGLIYFDRTLGITLFSNMYNMNANVFAAIPSLHSSYPVVVLIFGIKKKMRSLNPILIFNAAGIWFAAVYLRHHYVIDVLTGIAVGLFAYMIFEKILLRSRFGTFLEKLEESV